MGNKTNSKTSAGWFVYLLRCRDKTLYCGITKDMGKRLESHNKGIASRYTRSRLPVKRVAVSEAMPHGDALRLEIAVKKAPRGLKIKMVRSKGE